MIKHGFFNRDCIECMRVFPDGYFELAIVDPPYGDGGHGAWKCKDGSRFGGRFDKYKISAQPIKVHRDGICSHDKKIISWDSSPPPEYFEELFRVSQNQIIFGGNYFGLPPTRCFIVWDKKQPDGVSFAQAEYAWTSFNANAKIFRCAPRGDGGNTKGEKRIHVCQKPIALYKWLLHNYAKLGDKILDTHVGSASSLIVCEDMGYEYVGYEVDKGYYDAACQRMRLHRAQMRLDAPPTAKITQETL